MARRPHRPARLRGRFFRGSDAVRLGFLTPAQLRGKAWRPIFRDVFVDATVPDSHYLRCRAVRLILPEGAVVTGRSAACLDRLPLGKADDPVHVLAPPGTRWARRGCRLVRTSWLPAGHVLPGEPPTTIRPRTAWEIACEPDLVEAVVALDVLFRHQRPRKGALDSWVAAYPESPAAHAIALADGAAESPQESRTRVRLILAGFPAPVPQYRVSREGRLIARVDLAWPEAKVAVEYDGVWHAEARQLRKDRARLNRLVDAGWTVLHVTSVQLSDQALFAAFCGQLRAALARSGPATNRCYPAWDNND